MENAKESCGGEKPTEENQIPATQTGTVTLPDPPSCQRAPFTSLSQVEADLALARTLQEQERAYLMLRMNHRDGSEFGSSESGSYVDEEEPVDPNGEGDAESDGGEDAFDVHARAAIEDDSDADIDPSAFDSDEAYARALQEAHDREVAARFMAFVGINDWEAEDPEDEGSNSQDAWQEVDPDELSYEELIALSEVVGTESRGLSADLIASLPSTNYKAQSSSSENTDQCVICRLDYEDGEALIVLSCKHSYHTACINKWLQINKVCPVCSAEVCTSGSMEEKQGTSGKKQ